jgi:hypothetical protein
VPALISRAKVTAFRDAFEGPLDSLAAIYRQGMADALDVLGNAAAILAQRRRALAHLRQYNAILTRMRDEAAAWAQANLPEAYRLGMAFADDGIARIRKAGINLGRPQYETFAQVHQQAVAAAADEMLRVTDFAVAQIGRRVGDVFRRVGVEEVAKGIAEGKARVEVSEQIRERLMAEGKPFFTDRLGRTWDLDRYSEMVARTTTREAATRGTINRLLEHNIDLAQVSAHNASDFCIYYENVIVSIGPEPHPVYPPISAIDGGPPFHPHCAHVLTPFVERLATEAEKERGQIAPDLLGKSPAALQRRFRAEFPERARVEGQRLRQQAARARPRVRPAPRPT